MLDGMGVRGTIGVTAEQLSNQLPYVNGTEIRSARYGHATVLDLDRTMINYNYGRFSFKISFSCSYNYFIVLDYLDRPLTTRLVFGPQYGRVGNGLVSNRKMIQVNYFEKKYFTKYFNFVLLSHNL